MLCWCPGAAPWLSPGLGEPQGHGFWDPRPQPHGNAGAEGVRLQQHPFSLKNSTERVSRSWTLQRCPRLTPWLHLPCSFGMLGLPQGSWGALGALSPWLCPALSPRTQAAGAGLSHPGPVSAPATWAALGHFSQHCGVEVPRPRGNLPGSSPWHSPAALTQALPVTLEGRTQPLGQLKTILPGAPRPCTPPGAAPSPRHGDERPRKGWQRSRGGAGVAVVAQALARHRTAPAWL